MKINATQAAEILGVTTDRVNKLVKGGSLKDYKVRDAAKMKHFAQLDSTEVRAFKQTDEYKMLMGSARLHSLSNSTPKPNGYAAGPQGIGTLLLEMNAKLDRLLEVWG